MFKLANVSSSLFFDIYLITIVNIYFINCIYYNLRKDTDLLRNENWLKVGKYIYYYENIQNSVYF